MMSKKHREPVIYDVASLKREKRRIKRRINLIEDDMAQRAENVIDIVNTVTEVIVSVREWISLIPVGIAMGKSFFKRFF